MKTPSFWNSKNTLSTLLLPLAHLYDMAGTLYRSYIRPIRIPVPVICIGNLTAGGSGKTPVALRIGQMVKDKNVPVYFLSRGYGGKLKGPVLVDPKKHTARDVGDEPLLLAQLLPTIVAKDRVRGALFAVRHGARAIIMDDGFQNPTIFKSLSLVVIDGKVGLGNQRIIPAGPLREPTDIALKRAHAVIVLNRSTAVPALPEGKPVFYAHTLAAENTQALRGRKVVAFCGIAYPQKFFDTLSSAGAMVVEQASFADHQPYSDADIQKLIVLAHEKQALLVTTSKDFVRLSPQVQKFAYVADIRVEFDYPEIVHGVLDYILKQDEKI
jgi:tetraacyldisaccharide 4'-kinase